MAYVPSQFPRREKPLPLNPRRVRSGIKLSTKGVVEPKTWAGQRWARLVEEAVSGVEAAEAVEYATLGQTRRLAVENGVVRAAVQGRSEKPYQITFEFERFSPGQWDRIVEVLAEQAVHAAKLLAGELPPNIEDALAPLGLKLFPTNASEILVSTTCKTQPSARADGFMPWSKHMGCVGYIIADMLDVDPFMIFQMRGMASDELLERVRQKRALAGLGGGAAPVYAPVVSNASDAPAVPLEESLESFWEIGPTLELVDTPIKRPELSHPLLRRLGPSPFQGRFPMVGLLATCYDLIGEATISLAEEGEPENIEEESGDDGGLDSDTGAGLDGEDGTD